MNNGKHQMVAWRDAANPNMDESLWGAAVGIGGQS